MEQELGRACGYLIIQISHSRQETSKSKVKAKGLRGPVPICQMRTELRSVKPTYWRTSRSSDLGHVTYHSCCWTARKIKLALSSSPWSNKRVMQRKQRWTRQGLYLVPISRRESGGIPKKGHQEHICGTEQQTG